MVNAQLLDKKIEESGYKINFLLEKLGLSKSGFLLKRKNQRPFRSAEIYVLTDFLNLSEEEVKEIFFAEEVNQ